MTPVSAERAILGRDARTRDTHDARVTLVVGLETLLAERATAAVVVAARAADDEADVSEVAGGDLTAAALAEHVSPSLFATRRVLVVRGVEDVADPAARALVAYAHPVDDVHLVLVHPGGPKGKRLLDDFEPPGPGWSSATGSRVRTTRLTSFARRSRPRVGGSTRAARRLVEAVGGDLRGLASAAGQLAADAEGGVVDTAVVATYFEGRAEVKGWVVADRAVEGRTADALEQLRWALETAPIRLVTAALATAVRSLARLAGAPRGPRRRSRARPRRPAVEGPRPARATARVDPLGPGPRDPRRRRRRPAGSRVVETMRRWL